MKILYVTTIGGTMTFFRTFIRNLLNNGDTVDIATNENDGMTPVESCYREWGCKVYHLDTSRSPFSAGNIKAIKQIKTLVEEENYDLVHCHTPLASVATRQACKVFRKKIGLKVFYTAHGFHFYDGAPLLNWLIFYPIEKWYSRYTDVLFTINKEDYKRALDKFKAKKIVYIPGVGVDTEKFAPRKSGRERIRAELKIPNERILLLSVGELNKNKNHDSVIKAISGVKNITYVIVGKGELTERLQKTAKEHSVDLRLVGFRKDVADFYNAADVYILPSIREGLNVSLMEAMACELPCCVSRIRGNVDLVDEREGGLFFDPRNFEDCKVAIEKLLSNNYREMGKHNKRKICAFDNQHVIHKMNSIYQFFV